MSKWLSVMLSALMAIVFVGCAHEETKDTSSHDHQATAHTTTYKDGTYTGTSGTDILGGTGELTVTIQNGKITQAEYKGIHKDGTVKDIDYGKTNGKIENQEFYNKAQQAVKGASTYGPRLVETQDVDKVDAKTGATYSYKQFNEAGHKALDQAH